MQSEQINELAAALAKAQGEMKNATLNRTNPHFRSKYADLSAIRDAVISALSKNGLGMVQYTEWSADGLTLRTRLTHASGQWIESAYPLPVVLDKPQAMGSALTYARRYSMAAMCGISAEEDDDANAAQEAGRTVQKPASTKLAPSPAETKAKEIADKIKSAATVEDIDALWTEAEKHLPALPDAWKQRLEDLKIERAAELTPNAAE